MSKFISKYSELVKEQNELMEIYDYIGSGDELSNGMLEKLHKLLDDKLNELNTELDVMEYEAKYGLALNDECPICEAYLIDTVIDGESRVICPLCFE